MAEGTDSSRNEVEIDLDKYMALIDKLDTAEDTIAEMQEEARKVKDRLGPPKRKFMDLFLDDNDINEKINYLKEAVDISTESTAGRLELTLAKLYIDNKLYNDASILLEKFLTEDNTNFTLKNTASQLKAYLDNKNNFRGQ